MTDVLHVTKFIDMLCLLLLQISLAFTDRGRRKSISGGRTEEEVWVRPVFFFAQ